MRVLITNDDGVASPGLATLAHAVADLGVRPRIVAPAVDQSGVGTAVGRLQSRGLIAFEDGQVAGQPATIIQGPPALAVLLDQLGAFGEPSTLVLAGVNAGDNTGRRLVHSGTVGAALAAVASDAAGAAISLMGTRAQAETRGDGRSPSPQQDYTIAYHWETARAVAAVVVDALLSNPPRGRAVNINIPGLPLSRVRGWRHTTVADGGTSRLSLKESANGDSGATFQYGLWPQPFPRETDSGAIYHGYVSLTWLGSPYGFPAPTPGPADAAIGAALERLLPELSASQEVRI